MQARPRSRTHSVMVVLAIVATTGGCAPERRSLGSSAPAITHGVLDLGDDAVVALVVQEPLHTRLHCTGTLIAPQVVLTAGHCVHDAVVTGAELHVLFGAYIHDVPDEVIPVVALRAHPSFDRATLAHDIGLVLLSRAARARAVPFLSRALDSSFVGSALRLVGYGALDDGSQGVKHSGTTTLAEYDDATLTFHPDASITCRGDSGGPAFLSVDGVEQVVGVTSKGDPDCASFAIDTRVDAHAGDFIEPQLLAWTPGAAGPGERCLYAEHCAAGSCITADDDERVRYCSTPCRSTADCVPGMACGRDSTCRYLSPTPGALGGACHSGDDCVTGACARPSEGAAPVCTMRCFPSNDPPCPNGYACTIDADAPDRRACFAESAEGRGCATAGGGSPQGWAPVVLALAALSAARRRRRGS